MSPILRPLLLIAGLSACVAPQGNPLAPVDYGPGFGSYSDYEARRLARDGELSGALRAPGPAPSSGSASAAPAISPDELRAAGLPAGGSPATSSVSGGLPAAEPVPTRSIDDAFEDATDGVGPQSRAVPAAPAAPLRTDNPGLSDEQSFAAVSARESIDSDADRLARQRAAYTVIPPRAVPERQGPAGPNIVRYALGTRNAVGQPVHARGGLFGAGDGAACNRFASPDLAQREFLRRGGPERDRLGLDPDGDGFACGWDPAPFRAAQG